MKKTLFIIFVLIACMAEAQSLKINPDILKQGPITTVNGLHQSANCEWDTPKILSEMGTISPFKNLTAPELTTYQVLDSIRVWNLEVPNSTWGKQYRYIAIEYDANYNLTGEVMQAWNGSTWVDFSKYIYVYDNRNNLTNAIVQNWNGSAWENESQQIFTFDFNNNRITSLFQNYINDDWKNSQADTATYDANNNLTSKIYHTWNNGAWERLYLLEFSYDEYNYLNSYTSKSWNGNSWENLSLYTYTLNSNHKPDIILAQSWNNGSWRNHYLSTYSYDDNHNLTKKLEQNWYALEWINNIQELYSYDSRNNQTSALYQGWNGSEWFNGELFSYTYDDDNFVNSQKSYSWGADDINIRNGDSTYYYYQTVQGINGLANPDPEISIYPNPNNGKFAIKTVNAINSIEIYNSAGERIESKFQLKTQSQNEIDLRGMGAGIYFLKIYDGTKTYSRKVIIQ